MERRRVSARARLRSSAARFAFGLARSSAGGVIARWGFARMARWLPVERLDETALVIAFRHPKPSYPVHVLIVPKRAITGLAAITPADASVIVEVIRATQRLAVKLNLAERDYRLVANGGAYQDVRQLHFHLIAGDSAERGWKV